VSVDFLALRLFCFNIRQHGRQILYFKLNVDGRGLCTIVLNHVGFTTDTIVQVNHLLRRTRTPVFRFESHGNDVPCSLR